MLLLLKSSEKANRNLGVCRVIRGTSVRLRLVGLFSQGSVRSGLSLVFQPQRNSRRWYFYTRQDRQYPRLRLLPPVHFFKSERTTEMIRSAIRICLRPVGLNPGGSLNIPGHLSRVLSRDLSLRRCFPSAPKITGTPHRVKNQPPSLLAARSFAFRSAGGCVFLDGKVSVHVTGCMIRWEQRAV